MRAIPERRPIADHFRGTLLRADEAYLLALTPQADTETVTSGQLVVRYGIAYLGKPHLAIVPGLVALDYGDILTGEAAWEFLLHQSNLHPRADVVGYRNDGSDEMIAVKYLDLAQPIHVLVFPDTTASQPIGHVSALIAADTAGIAQRLLDYLPVFDSLEAWQNRE
ncbi:MAG: hypothetical protein CL610_03655 [Anaerolineaceae bacterium]|nr:hypothetical protein [Anaerolineaceae bacterium]